MRLNYIDNIDCLQGLKEIPDKSVDLIVTDPPYGSTACEWDQVIPFDLLWTQYKRIIRDDGAVLMFGTEPFASKARMSNLSMYKYDWIWHKSKCGSAFTSKYRPQQKHENIMVFGKGRVNYHPIMREGTPYRRARKANDGSKPNNHKLGVIKESETINTGFRYPETVIFFQQKWRRQDQLHPTQKPVPLLEYLIRTYTNEGDVVLDPFMGSGTTAVACIKTGRNYIGFELDEGYHAISLQRIAETQAQLNQDKEANQ